MSTTFQTNTGPGPAAIAGVAPVLKRRNRRTILLVAGVILLLLLGTYAFAWFNAQSLSSQFLNDADSSYQSGKYLNALVGYQEFNGTNNSYVNHGGYLQVQHIWADSYAWPKPDDANRATARINEIINQKIGLAEAEQFIQANTGKQNPYFGVIYLRLGQLYEQSGATSDARDVYNSIVESFPTEADLVAQAKDRLAHLK